MTEVQNATKTRCGASLAAAGLALAIVLAGWATKAKADPPGDGPELTKLLGTWQGSGDFNVQPRGVLAWKERMIINKDGSYRKIKKSAGFVMTERGKYKYDPQTAIITLTADGGFGSIEFEVSLRNNRLTLEGGLMIITYAK